MVQGRKLKLALEISFVRLTNLLHFQSRTCNNPSSFDTRMENNGTGKELLLVIAEFCELRSCAYLKLHDIKVYLEGFYFVFRAVFGFN